MYRRMCFNVYAHNRDDHAKNFSFLYEEEKKCWRLSPAYDLTYSTTYYGEHTTTVAGNGKNPGSKELIFVGTQAGLSKEKCRSIAVENANFRHFFLYHFAAITLTLILAFTPFWAMA